MTRGARSRTGTTKRNHPGKWYGRQQQRDALARTTGRALQEGRSPRFERNVVRQSERQTWRQDADLPKRGNRGIHRRRHRRRDLVRRKLSRRAPAFIGVAHACGHLSKVRRCPGGGAHPFRLLRRRGEPRDAAARFSLSRRRVWRRRCPLRPLLDVRQTEACRRCIRGARRPHGVPAREPRNDRSRTEPDARGQPGPAPGDHVPAVCAVPTTGRTATADRRRLARLFEKKRRKWRTPGTADNSVARGSRR